MPTCEGTCSLRGECKGEVKRYNVGNWGLFWYCETAVETDRSNGLAVLEEEDTQ